MINYFKGGIYDTHAQLVIDLDNLNLLIKHNPKQKEIETLRSLKYKSVHYTIAKEKLPNVTIHGTFNGSREIQNINKFSGLFYFDYDKSDMKGDLEAYKNMLIKKHSDKICMIGKSVGGSGLFLIVRVKNVIITKDNFNLIWNHLKNDVFNDIVIDKRAGGINRVMYISYDEDVYYNPLANYQYNISISDKKYEQKKNVGQLYNVTVSSVYNKPTSFKSINNTIPFDIIPINKLIENMVTETPHPLQNDTTTPVLIKSLPYAYINHKLKIVNGRRHSTIKKLICQIKYLNPIWDEQKIFSYVYYINQKNCIEKLKHDDLYRTFCNFYEKIKKEVIKVSVKTIWTNPNFKNRRKIASEANSKLKSNQIITAATIIIKEILPLVAPNEKITQNSIIKHSNGYLSIDKVRRNWQAIKEIQNNSYIQLPQLIEDKDPKCENDLSPTKIKEVKIDFYEYNLLQDSNLLLNNKD